MCQAGLFDDDSQIDKLLVERGAIVKGGCCKVTISIYE
jgi:Holliday junction resolvase RusA-like endonuclease